MSPLRFALIGAAGFVAPRHLQAIKDVGGRLVAALDLSDSVGILDRFDRTTDFFTTEHAFIRHLERMRQAGAPLDWLVVASPNHLHYGHVLLGLRAGARVICEKPLVVSPQNLHDLAATETELGGEARVFTVLQLRHHAKLQRLQQERADASIGVRDTVLLRYTTPRGRWYHRSWKGDDARSGGLITNIGVHMLDALLWIWGGVRDVSVYGRSATRVAGMLALERANVRFVLSIEPDEAPERLLVVNGNNVEFTDGFADLHTTVYREILAGQGHGVEDARPSIELAAQIRSAPLIV